jgi:hypothetical protein
MRPSDGFAVQLAQWLELALNEPQAPLNDKTFMRRSDP